MNDILCVLHVLTWPAWFVCDVPSIHRHGDPRHRGTKEMMMMRRRRRMNMVMKMIVMIEVVMMNEVKILVVMMRMNGMMRMMVSSLTWKSITDSFLFYLIIQQIAQVAIIIIQS